MIDELTQSFGWRFEEDEEGEERMRIRWSTSADKRRWSFDAEMKLIRETSVTSFLKLIDKTSRPAQLSSM